MVKLVLGGVSGGLEDLLNNQASSVSSAQTLEGDYFEKIECDKIDDNPTQPRVTIDPLFFEELRASIRARGVEIAIVVRPGASGRYILVAGQCRLKASRENGLETIPALVRNLDVEAAHLVSILENASRSPVPIVEEAMAFLLMKEKYGWSQAKIGKTFGKSEGWVSRILALTTLPPTIMSAVKNGYATGLNAITHLRLAYSKDAVAVDKFLATLSAPLSASRAEALYNKVNKKKVVKVVKPPRRLSEKAIIDRISLATKKVDSGAELSAKQISAMDLLTAISLDGEDIKAHIKLMAVALFPEK